MALDAKVILLLTSIGNTGKNKNKEYVTVQVDVYFIHGTGLSKKNGVTVTVGSSVPARFIR